MFIYSKFTLFVKQVCSQSATFGALYLFQMLINFESPYLYVLFIYSVSQDRFSAWAASCPLETVKPDC